jgi:hypothetical protein
MHDGSLGVEKNTMFRLVVDLDLRVIGTHVALTACLGQTRERDRCGMSRVTIRACADRTVCIRTPYRVAGDATSRLRDRTFESSDRVRRTIDCTGMELFGERDLLRFEIARTGDGGP